MSPHVTSALPELAPDLHAEAARPSLREHPDWAPVRGSFDLGDGWSARSWEEPRLPGDIGQDSTLLVNLGPTLRVAVMDACQNMLVEDSERVALRATHTIRAWLRTELDPVTALHGAANSLCDPALRPRQRNPIATAAVVDIDRRTGHATAYRCSDSEVWVKRNGVWVEAFLVPFLTPLAHEAYHADARAKSHWSRSDWWAHQEHLLDDPAVWNTTPLGMEPYATFQRADLGVVDEIIVTTDGPRLNAERCADVMGWLGGGLQEFPTPDWPHPSPHGDIALAHLIRT